MKSFINDNKRIIYFLSIIVLVFISGCSSDTNRPTETTSSQYNSQNSEVSIRNLSDQIAEWTEGQFYPGAYQKESASFVLPAEPTSFVQELEGVLFAYGNPFNEEGTERIHLLRRIDGLKEIELFLAEIPGDYTLYNLQIKNNTIFILAYPFRMLSDTENSHMELFIYTTEGEFLRRDKLCNLLGEQKIADYTVTSFSDNDGNLWIRVPEQGKLYCVQPDGQIAQIITIPIDFQGGFMRGKESDELIAVLGTGTGVIFWKLDTKTNDSKTYTIENLPGVQSVFPGTAYDALVMTEKSVYGVNLGEPVLVKELFTFTDLGVDRTILRSIEDHKDGSLSAVLLERTKTEGERVSLIPQTTIVHEGLTLACLKSNEYLNYAVSTYNQQHPDNKVTIKEYYDKYAVDASETDALNRLNSDLMDGTAGDIICLDGLNFTGKANSYLDKGVFTDLYELMDNDPEFHKEDYFTDIFRVNETEGRLYRLVPFFTLNTKYGRVDDVGETTHLDESLLFETDPVTNLFGPMYRRTEFIHDLLVFSLGDLQDPKAIFYDCDQMVSYICIAKSFPDFEMYSGTGEMSSGYREASYRKWKDLRDHVNHFYYSEYHKEDAFFRILRTASVYLDQPGLYPIPDEIDSIDYRRNLGIRVAFSGFPIKKGCGSAVINCLTVAISATSEAPEEAWGFMKTLLSEEYQSIRKLCYYAIPIRKSVFNQIIERLMAYQDKNDDPAYLQGGGGRVSETGEDITYWTPITQQWMVDTFLDLLTDITIVDEVDPSVEAILNEEITKFCDGLQTAEETANNIKERVQLYADEQ